MIQCRDCELFEQDESGRFGFKCDPFNNVKEPDCIMKWQLIKIGQMVQSHQATLDHHRRLGPMMEKMFTVMEREMGDMDESDKWKVDEDEDEDKPKDTDDDWPQ